MTRLNSTGSLSYLNGSYWSYNTKLTDSYKGYNIFNDTYYSATTRKHQCYVNREYNYDIALHCCSYGDWNCLEMIKREIQDLKYKLEKRQSQRNTAKKKEDINYLNNQIKFLEDVIKEDTADNKENDWFNDFENTWNELSEENKQHVRNGLGDNLITSVEQAKNITGVMKMMSAFQQLGI